MKPRKHQSVAGLINKVRIKFGESLPDQKVLISEGGDLIKLDNKQALYIKKNNGTKLFQPTKMHTYAFKLTDQEVLWMTHDDIQNNHLFISRDFPISTNKLLILTALVCFVSLMIVISS